MFIFFSIKFRSGMRQRCYPNLATLERNTGKRYKAMFPKILH